MKRRYLPASVALSLLLCVSCGGEVRPSAPEAPAVAGANARGGTCGSAPVPKEHRPVAQACPSQRGSGTPLDMSTCTNRSSVACTKDTDCTAGLNGRCLAHNVPCATECSYDECLTDSDCASGPCLCRDNGTATLSNQCLPRGTCKTDADCGACGYCSPSATPTGLGCHIEEVTYMCHTPSDECSDESSCDGGYCAYDGAAARWACGRCVPIPHPR